MKLVIENGTINLDNFDKICYRESFLGPTEGYPVEATKTVVSGRIFKTKKTIAEEVERFSNKTDAKKLVEDITTAWINGEKTFDIPVWIAKCRDN